jgi:hypothetical protein
MQQIDLESLRAQAGQFAMHQSSRNVPKLYGVDNGKSIGTYIENEFSEFMRGDYEFTFGSAASGLDLPQLEVDIKTTSITQPQSSCPYSSARQKIYGLGYHLLVFVYDKTDDMTTETSNLDISHSVFIRKERTADYQTTTSINRILKNNGNKDDILGLLEDRQIPGDEIQHNQIAEEILEDAPKVGYVTISNALQWRLQYNRAIDKANEVDGIYDMNQ